MAWYIDSGGNLTNDEFIETPEKVMVKPYPAALWRIDDEDFPIHTLLPELPDLGAFAYAENLAKIRIPKSIKRIGEKSFRHTALKKVKIARDCEYSPTSFPEGCKIEFYD